MGYGVFAGADAAADAVAVSFWYSDLACWSIGISGSASFQVVKKCKRQRNHTVDGLGPQPPDPLF